MTRLCLTSTFFGAMQLAAAYDSGVLARPDDDRQILLISSNATAPELAVPWHDTPAGAAVLARFDRVVVLGEELRPFHPRGWQPRDEDLPLLARLLRTQWDMGSGPVELVLESIHAAPASSLARIFHDAPIRSVSEGLVSYGPSPTPHGLGVTQRLQDFAYLDLLDGVTPLVLAEDAVALSPVAVSAFARVVAEARDAAAADPEALPYYGDRPTSLLLGQQLSELGIFSAEEEVRHYLALATAAIEIGAERVVFKPHPSAAPAIAELLNREAQSLDAEFAVLHSPLTAEIIASAAQLHSVASACSTGLVTLNRLFGVTPVSAGCEELLERLSPYQNSQRIPVTIVDALTRQDAFYREPAALQHLIDSVGFCMRPLAVPELHPAASSFVAGLAEEERRRYFKKRRLESLGLAPAESASPQ